MLYVLTRLTGATSPFQGRPYSPANHYDFSFQNVALVISDPLAATDDGNGANIKDIGLYAKYFDASLFGAIRWSSNPALDLQYPGLSQIGGSGINLAQITSVDQTFQSGDATNLSATIDPRTIGVDRVQSFYTDGGSIGGPYNGITSGSFSYTLTGDGSAITGQASFSGQNSANGQTSVWQGHFIGRAFDGLEYLASNPDLVAPLGLNKAAAEQHYVTYGYGEARQDNFDGLSYVAAYRDLITAFQGTRDERGLRDLGSLHDIQHGQAEGRTARFDGLDYVASYPDLIKAIGANADGGSMHFIDFGASEGRAITFDPLEYIASNVDLIKVIGDDITTAAGHYMAYGVNEGRPTASFNAQQYLANYADLRAAFGTNTQAAEAHFIHNGYAEGRTDHLTGT